MPVQTSLVSSSKQSGCLGSTSVRHYLISILISMCYELFEGGDSKCLGTPDYMDWEVHFRTWGADYMGFYPPSGHTSRGWRIGPWCRQRWTTSHLPSDTTGMGRFRRFSTP